MTTWYVLIFVLLAVRLLYDVGRQADAMREANKYLKALAEDTNVISTHIKKQTIANALDAKKADQFYLGVLTYERQQELIEAAVAHRKETRCTEGQLDSHLRENTGMPWEACHALAKWVFVLFEGDTRVKPSWLKSSPRSSS